ncbi:MAG: hypothetical protein WKG07_21250 [Hymenobacter sp.]
MAVAPQRGRTAEADRQGAKGSSCQARHHTYRQRPARAGDYSRYPAPARDSAATARRGSPPPPLRPPRLPPGRAGRGLRH